ncbi:MAG: nitrate oxidoreductase subunit beta [Deltaproteobacteria bacterium]|nr:nitrate oxidoreductase subunit beta [Deltaproteobacteria bacterium]MBI2501595.1 nitrate oxidoreductase subunit beta [Deltaproteobacteria bacterium]
MAKVYNWQIGREMDFPYEEAHPKRQFAAVFNINRCIACQTCSMACKSTWTFSKGQEYMWWNNVETKPYGGYPRNWDVKLLAMLAKADPEGQKTIFEAAPHGERVLGYLPEDREWKAPNLYEDTSTKYNSGGSLGLSGEGVSLPEHKAWFFYLQRICNHCTYPACLAACPRKAIYKRPEDGIVLVDQERCRGYRKCMEACPYKKPMFNAETRVTEKCIGCYPRIEGKDPLLKGKRMETRCMSACVGQIRLQGLVDVQPDGSWAENRQHPLYYLIKVAKIALPLYPQFGTEPNIYYIPPRWVPKNYLHQMFGPGVDEAVDRYLAPDRELLAVLQLFRRSQEIVFRYDIEEGPKLFETIVHGKPFTLYNDTVIAFGEDGKEIFRTTVEEPTYLRPKERTNAV